MSGRNVIVSIVLGFAGTLYERIYEEPISPDIERFILNLSKVMIGTLTASVFSFTFTIVSGRLLGPFEFGQYSLVQSLGMVLYLPMLAGMNSALIKRVSEGDNVEIQRGLISTSYVVVFGLMSLIIVVCLVAADPIAAFFSITPEVFVIAIIFAALFVLYTLTTSTLLGLHEMKLYALFQPIYSAIMLAALVLFYLRGPLGFEQATYATIIAYGVTAGAILIRTRRYISFSFHPKYLRMLGMYAVLALVGCVAFTINQNAGKLLLNNYLSAREVGIYGVYFYSAFTIITLISTVFTTVLYPSVSRHGNIRGVFTRAVKGFRYIFFLGLPFAFAVEYLLLRLFGASYPIDPFMMVLFALTAIAVNGFGLFQWIFNAGEIQGGMMALRLEVIASVLALGLTAVLVPLFGINGAIGGLGIAFFVGLVLIYHRGRRYFLELERTEGRPDQNSPEKYPQNTKYRETIHHMRRRIRARE
jgi:O-antigen/teichoic acid export membrane protein